MRKHKVWYADALYSRSEKTASFHTTNHNDTRDYIVGMVQCEPMRSGRGVLCTVATRHSLASFPPVQTVQTGSVVTEHWKAHKRVSRGMMYKHAHVRISQKTIIVNTG